MHVLLLTIGSHGDVHPFIGLAIALKNRGHAVSFSTNDYFRPLVERAGISDFIALGSAEQYSEMAKRPELWEHRRGVELILDFVARGLADVYDVAANYHALHPTDGVVVSSTLAMGARVAQDALHFPMATLHLAPAVLRSLIEPAKLPGLFMPRWLPTWMKRSMWSVADRYGIDPIICPSLNAFRAEKNLPPVRRAMKDWIHSPDRVLAMWPAWFAPVQADWPPQTRLCGFPLYDEAGLAPLPPRLEQFLDAGEKPIAFTPGSAMWRGEDFFNASLQACIRLGKRGVLLSRHGDHIPKQLPSSVIHVPFAPFSELLPRVAALVHHGGIGTTSQALRAGVPQLIVAMSHDQFDNAARVERLGVGGRIQVPAYDKTGSSDAVARLMAMRGLGVRCREVKSKFTETRPLESACEWVEELDRRSPR